MDEARETAGRCGLRQDAAEDTPDSPRQRVLDWVHGFVLRPHSRLGRTGAVCPFVEPAMRQDTFTLRESHLSGDTGMDALVGELMGRVTEFLALDWQGNRTLHAMLVLLPEFSESDALALDEAHALIKDRLVLRDVMMAPFHPRCTEPAARNPELMAFRSPVPMVAIRRLAFHDILFLHERREWFHHYAHRFGKRYHSAASLDPAYVAHYRAGVDAFGEPPV